MNRDRIIPFLKRFRPKSGTHGQMSLPKTPSTFAANDLRRLRFQAVRAMIAGFHGSRLARR